ncbi:hypothetical protein NPIL_679321 [Nephila pilipes]|uniref:Uncharacterized protein n=1 Tax=Nephila pilipes TaxID=299642 RepID=A0A8X6NMV4_NEPPI|nr:hypothetical protein NPIL_679321 [Nephila pilipes]
MGKKGKKVCAEREGGKNRRIFGLQRNSTNSNAWFVRNYWKWRAGQTVLTTLVVIWAVKSSSRVCYFHGSPLHLSAVDKRNFVFRILESFYCCCRK